MNEKDSKNEHEIIRKVQKKKMLDAAMNFWAKRKRPWQLFVFHDGYREMREFLLETITETPDFTSMLPNLRRIIYLYNDVGLGLLDRRSRRKQVKRETP